MKNYAISAFTKVLAAILILVVFDQCKKEEKPEPRNNNNNTTERVPDAPANLKLQVVSATQIDLTWKDNASNETGFRVERSLNGTGNWTNVTGLGKDVTGYSDKSLQAETKYYYRVYANNSKGNSEYSNVASAITLAAGNIPAGPGNLVLTVMSTSEIKLNWNDNSDNEIGFKVEISLNGVSGWYTQASLAENSTTTVIEGLSPDTRYYFRVLAYNSYGNSSYSNIAEATTDKVVTVPVPPSGLELEARSPSRMRITWQDNSDNETGFEIQRQNPDNETQWMNVTTMDANQTIYFHDGLNHTWPAYRVRAINGAGASDWTIPALAPPKLRVINNLYDKTATIDWGKGNALIRLRVGPTLVDVSSNYSAYEQLYKYETSSSIQDYIPPKYLQTTSYKDYELNDISGVGSSYYIWAQCGYWDYVSNYWEKHYTLVKDKYGSCCVTKWAWRQIVNHKSGYFIITASELGLVHGSWNGQL